MTSGLSKILRPSTIASPRIAVYNWAQSGMRNSFHSVMSATASAPSAASYIVRGIADRPAGHPPLRFGHGDRVVDTDLGAGIQQVVDHHRCRGFAHVVRLGFEGQSPDRDEFAPQVAQGGLQFLEDHAFLLFVDPLDSFDDRIV